MKPIAVAFSDIHLHEFRAYNNYERTRLEWSLIALKYILMKGIKHEVPVLFAGDLLHHPEHASNKVINLTLAVFNEFFKCGGRFGYIYGNHDIDGYSSLKAQRPMAWTDMLDIYEGAVDLYSDRLILTNGAVVRGINYLSDSFELTQSIKDLVTGLKEKNEKTILLLHGDAPGAVTPSGFEVSEHSMPNNLNKFFKQFELVLMGHIHKPQQLCNNAYMLGSPIQQTLGDMGTKMGYWIVYEDFSMKFKCLNKKFPVFTTDKEHKEIDYYIESLEKEAVEETKHDLGDFHVKVDRAKLAKRYLKHKGIKSKKKLKALVEVLNKAE